MIENGDRAPLSFALGTWTWTVPERAAVTPRLPTATSGPASASAFPISAGAASTRYYSDNEQRLFTEHFPALDGLRILKTDLWDEAKNTRILAWASRQGARAYGVDISEPTVMQARAAFDRVRRATASAGRRRRRARPAVPRRQLRRDLLDGHDRALRRNRARRRGDGARAQTRRPRHRRRAEPARSVSPAAARRRRSRRSGSTATATRSPTRAAR